MEGDLEPVVRLLAENRWPWRLHATYNETITPRARRLREGQPGRSVRRPALVLRPCRNHQRPQHRAHRGARRRHRRPAPHGVPGRVFRRPLRREGGRAHAADPAHAGGGMPVGAGTDATRVASYNPWVSLVLAGYRQDGRAACALSRGQPARPRDRAAPVDRGEHLVLQRRGQEGRIEAGQLADLAVLSDDYFAVPETEIKDIASGSDDPRRQGRASATATSSALAPALPRPMPDWSPVATSAAIGKAADRETEGNTPSRLAACGCASSCGVHGHAHASAWGASAPASDARSFWGALGCSCWAF